MKRYTSKFTKKTVFRQWVILAALLIALSIQGVSAQTQPPANAPANPEPATPLAQTGTKTAYGARFMVVTANDEATRAGYQVLKDGGSAADAAVAVQAVLGLVEPQSSGLGGGGFALYYDKKSNQVYSFDGRETAPAQAG